MKVHFVGKNISIRDNFKDLTLEKLERLDKYFDEDVHATVTMSTEGSQEKRVEVTIPVPGSDAILRADQTSFDMLQSVDQCVSALVSQIRKYKTKLKNRHKDGTKTGFLFDQIEDLPEEAVADDVPDIARVKEIDVQPMTPEEAVLQMDLLGHDFSLFLNMEEDTLSVVYRRKAGNYGMITPSEGRFIK